MKFSIIGKGFIYPKHEEAIKAVGGEIVEENEDCVVILTPNHLHFDMVMRAIKRNKTVLCEKPLALTIEHLLMMSNFPNVFTVSQLRYLPKPKETTGEIDLQIIAPRDESYWNGWKGDKEKSGGLLFNLGIHYFDLILYWFGIPTEVKVSYLDEKIGVGKLIGKDYVCNWKIDTTLEIPKRTMTVNGKKINLTSKKNLHIKVYKDLIKGKGITPSEVVPVTMLINEIYEKGNIQSG